MTRSLDFGIDIKIPLEAATATFAILAKRRVGKSNTAVVMAETFYGAGIPFCAVDPKGDWWGLRAKGPRLAGLKVVIFGGLHADVPIESNQGAFIADLIARERISCVLDVSEFSEAEKNRFLTDFALRLLRVNRHPLHCFFEEADDYIPQKPFREQARTVGAFQKLVKNGGFRGIGVTLVSHRSAVINKDVLNQAGNLIVHRTIAPHDIAAVGAWLKYQGAAEAVQAILSSLAKLGNGEAWLVSPELLRLDEPIRVKFPRRGTFDSGDTPRVGGRAKRARTLADIDIDSIREQMKDTIEKAKAEDPRELRKRIAELEKAVRDAPRPASIIKVAESPDPIRSRDFSAVSKGDLRRLGAVVTRMEKEAARYGKMVNSLAETAKLTATMQDRLVQAQQVVVSNVGNLETAVKLLKSPKAGRPFGDAGSSPTGGGARRTVPRIDTSGTVTGRFSPKRPNLSASSKANGETKLPKGAREILVALATMNKPLTVPEAAAITGIPPRSSTMRNYRSMLKVAGLIEIGADGRLVLTEGGLGVVGDGVGQPRTSQELWAFWSAKLPEGARKMLTQLMECYPSTISRSQLGDECEIDPSTSTFRNYMSMLKVRGLVTVSGDSVGASETLFQGDR